MSLLTALWSKLASYVAVAGALLAGIGAIWLKGRARGKEIMAEEQARHKAESITAKRKLDHETDSLAPADVDDQFQRWVRKGSPKR